MLDKRRETGDVKKGTLRDRRHEKQDLRKET